MQELIILGAVKHIRKTLPRCGLRKLHFELQNFKKMHQIKMGRDKLANLLREHNLLIKKKKGCLLYTSPSPRDRTRSRMPSSA